jgi:site-specific DNA-methyltransferase (adenine-specific)
LEVKELFAGMKTILIYRAMKITENLENTNEDNMLLMARYPDNYFDLAIVDPPYGIARFGSRVAGNRIDKGNKINEWDIKPNEEYFKELFRVSKFQIIWGANNFILPTTEYFLVWNKKQTVENFASAEYAWTNVKKPAQIFDYSIHKTMADRKAEGGKIHPTQKPVALYKWILDKYAKPGDKILDTHLGSGSIAIACHDYKFDLTACELDKEYYDAAVKRITNHVGQTKLF